MLTFQKNIFKVNLQQPTPVPGGIEEAVISDPSGLGDVCALDLLTTVYVETQNIGTITNGDIVYSDSLGTTPFDGSNFYYGIKISSQTQIYTVIISSIGVIELIGTCVENNVPNAFISTDFIEDPNTGCSFTATQAIGLSQQDPESITTNDVVYVDSFGLIPFNGGNQYYKIKISNNTEYICLVGVNGVVNLYQFCL